MLDANGCHECKTVCEKFGVPKGYFHCHVFAPEASEIYQRVRAGSAANDEAMYADNVLKALDFISLAPDKSTIKIASIKKDIIGEYKVISQSCGFGASPSIIKSNAPATFKKLFGINLSKAEGSLFSMSIAGKEALLIPVANNHLIAVDTNDKIICGGQFIHDKLYLFCSGNINERKVTATSGYCRTSLNRN